MKLVKPNQADKAPRPRRAGITQVLYDVVDALSGPSSIAEIKSYIPAAIESSTQIFPDAKIQRGLYRSVYLGYLVSDPERKRYQIAPLSYYENRQQIVKEMRENAENRQVSSDRSYERVEQPYIAPPSKPNYWMLATVSIVSGLIGYVIGALT